MSRSRGDDVLTDYVRERLDRLVAQTSHPGARDEGALRTVVRPRPALDMGEGAEVEPEPGDDWILAEPEVPEPASPPPRPQAVAPQRPGLSIESFGRFGRRHVAVVGVVLALGVLFTGYAMTRARSVPVAAPVPVERAAPVAHPESGAAASVTPVADALRVHVVGEVLRPGVHRLPAGARVADAIEAAGGLNDRAKPGELNLAQPLVDGQQLVIGGPQRPSEVRGGSAEAPGPAPGPGSGPARAPAGGKLNLNTATAAQLDTLPGIGPVTAEKIIAWRTEHKRFTRVEELQEVPGIGPKSFAEIAPHVSV